MQNAPFHRLKLFWAERFARNRPDRAGSAKIRARRVQESNIAQ
jgi:hypothetical protein